MTDRERIVAVLEAARSTEARLRLLRRCGTRAEVEALRNAQPSTPLQQAVVVDCELQIRELARVPQLLQHARRRTEAEQHLRDLARQQPRLRDHVQAELARVRRAEAVRLLQALQAELAEQRPGVAAAAQRELDRLQAEAPAPPPADDEASPAPDKAVATEAPAAPAAASPAPAAEAPAPWPPPQPDPIPCPGGCDRGLPWTWQDGLQPGPGVPSFRWGRWLRPIVKGPCADCVAAAEAARVEALRPAVWPPPQPQPWICHTSGCDTELPHVWVDGTWHGPSWQRGRWSPPSSYLCPACTEAAEAAERERQIQLRIADTGLPVKLRGYRWDRVREYTTTRGERVRHADRGRITHAQFQRFQRELQPGTLGITPWNKRLAQTLRGLCTPGMPLQSWIVLGPVGTGKSTLLAATVAGLVGRGLECRYITEADLWALVRSQWGNTSRKAARVDVVQQLVDVPVLALDDLGTVEQPRPWHVDGMERLICGRYDHGRATLITTNATLQQLADTYGERVASRLVELVDRGQRYVRLGGPDWRTGTVRPDEAPPASSPTEQPADGSCSECGYSPCRCGGSRP